MIIIELIYNVSLLVSLSVLSGFIDARFKRTLLTGKILQGILFGFTAIVGMLYPFVLSEGVFFDGRSIVVSLCTLFFGPVSGIIAAFMAAIYRLYIGGMGTTMGLLVILSSLLIGYSFYLKKIQTANNQIRNLHLYLLGFIVHFVMLLLMILLPTSAMLAAYNTVGFTVIGIYPVMTLLIGKILSDQESSNELYNILGKSEEKFRTLVEHAFDGIYMMEDTKYTYVNERFSEITGYSKEELLSDSFDFNSLLTEKSKNIVRDRYLARKRGEQVSVTYQIQLVSKDGREKEVELSAASIGDSEHVGVIGIMRDITYRKRAERELESAKERMQVLVEGTPHLFFYVQDINGDIKYISPSVEKMTGYSVAEWLGQHHWFTTVSPINEEARKRTSSNLRGELNFDAILTEIKHADGSNILLEIYEKPIFDDDKVMGLQGVAHDVTKQKIAEEKLKEINTRLQTAIEGANIGIWDQDFKENTVLRLGRWGEMLGYKAEQIHGDISAWRKLIHPDDIEMVKELTDRHKKGFVDEFKVEHRLLTAGGEYKWILNWGRIYQRDEHGNPLRASGIHLDIDDRKRAELAIEEARVRAERANKLKSEFLAQISHEIRSPLNAVLNFSQLLKEEFINKMTEDIQIAFSGIDSASKRVIRTIDLILNMSELQLGTYEISERDLDLVAMLTNIRKEYLNLARSKKLELELKTDLDTAVITSDEYAVNQIFANLVDNAIKYTKSGFVKIHISKEDNSGYKVDIIDSGVGISKEFIPEIFDAFSQEEQGYSRRFEGSGLGMSLVKKYCDLIGAEISIESQREKGTTFTVKLK